MSEVESDSETTFHFYLRPNLKEFQVEVRRSSTYTSLLDSEGTYVSIGLMLF